MPCAARTPPSPPTSGNADHRRSEGVGDPSRPSRPCIVELCKFPCPHAFDRIRLPGASGGNRETHPGNPKIAAFLGR